MNVMDYLISILTRNEFFDTVLVGLLGIFLLKVAGAGFNFVTNAIFAYKNFSLAGSWVSIFESYAVNKHNIELLHISQKGENVLLRIEQYNNTGKSLRKFVGKGIFRGNVLSAVYYPVSSDNVQNGVFVLRVIDSPDHGVMLDGKYTEFGHKSINEASVLQQGEYRLYRINLPILKKIRKTLQLRCFHSYEGLRKFVNS